MTVMAQPATAGLASRQPVGIFDSGVGGLSVAREIRRALPAEDLLYVADTAYCPYGDREVEEVRARALAVGRHLEAAGAKVIIVACNTATGAALESLREALTVPVIGLEPAVKTGAARTRNRRVGVMATVSTLRSERFARLVSAHGEGVEVLAQPCPGLADLIEQGHLDGEVLAARVGELTRPLLEARWTPSCSAARTTRSWPRRCAAPGPRVELVDTAPPSRGGRSGAAGRRAGGRARPRIAANVDHGGAGRGAAGGGPAVGVCGRSRRVAIASPPRG